MNVKTWLLICIGMISFFKWLDDKPKAEREAIRKEAVKKKFVDEAVRKKFVDYAKRQAYHNYIDYNKEYKIYEEGLKNGISEIECLAILREEHIDLERDIIDSVSKMLHRAADSKGNVNSYEYERCFEYFKSLTRGTMSDRELMGQMGRIISDNEWFISGRKGSSWD